MRITRKRSLTARHVTSTDYCSPYRPVAVRLANRVGRVLSQLGIRADLSESSLLYEARRRTGLQDFGEEAFRNPLSVLLDSIEREARLTPVGRLITRERLLGVLHNRLRAEKLYREHPEILAQELAPPVVITGLQRTGTTLLHRLLASDPQNRSLLSWEAINPAPFLGAEKKSEDPRIEVAKMSERALSYLAPDFFAIHPVEADAPEEDVLLLDYAFLSTVPEATLRVPTYSRWLEEQDHRPAYEYMKRLLKLLQWQRAAKRWVLKSPHHLEFLDTLLEVFPGAKVIQIHRDPCTTLASFCSMIAHGRGVFSDDVDPLEVGRNWYRKVRRMISRCIEVREKASPDLFLDVAYHDLLHDPMREVERIYTFLDIPLTEAVRRSMEKTLKVQVQHRYGSHRYQLEDFGLDRDTIKKDFYDYRLRFAISKEESL